MQLLRLLWLPQGVRGVKGPFVTVKRGGFKITAGTPTVFRAVCGEKCDINGAWNFCPKCGTQLFWLADKGDEVDIFAGTFDDPSVFKVKE